MAKMYVYCAYQLLPAPEAPKQILSGLNNEPIGDALITSIIPGSKSTKHARGTNLIVPASA